MNIIFHNIYYATNITWSFQAPRFYPKFGYTVFGTLDCPPGNKRFFLQKRLTEEP